MADGIDLRGITEIRYALEQMERAATEDGARQFVNGVADAVHEQYVKNLSGSVPSTTARRLPVGVRTRRLLRGARKEYAAVGGAGKEHAAGGGPVYVSRVFNDVPYAGFIEFGTRFMARRNPLLMATMEAGDFEARMEDVVRRIVQR